MRCDSQAFLLACTLASPRLGLRQTKLIFIQQFSHEDFRLIYFLEFDYLKDNDTTKGVKEDILLF
jgi:hypothetical protein